MSVEQKRILSMVAEGKITVEEAEKLLNALSLNEVMEEDPSLEDQMEPESRNQGSHSTRTTTNKRTITRIEGGWKKPKFLHVKVEPKSDNEDAQRVHIKVPLQLLSAGVKLASLVPNNVENKVQSALKKEGIEFDMSKLKDGTLEELVDHLGGINIDVDSKDERVKIFCE